MSLFISYSSMDKSYAEEIDSKLSRYGVTVIRDERDLKPLANIRKFMQEIKNSDYAVCLISDNYLKSANCLFEFNGFTKVPDLKGRLMPVLLPGMTFSNDMYTVFVAQSKEADRLRTEGKERPFVSVIREWFSPKKHRDDSQLAQFNKAWSYLTALKCFGYNDIAGKSFKDVFAFVGVYEDKVWDEAALIKKIADPQEREIAYEKLMQRYPEGFATLYNRAIVCDDNKEYKLAEFYYQEFLKKFPRPDDQVMGLYGLGLTYTHIKNYGEAIKCHTRAISLNPGAWKSYQGLGDVYIKQHQNQEALDNYKAAYNIVKDTGPALGIGSALYNMGDYAGATKFLSESVRLDKHNQQAQEFLKLAKEKISDQTKAAAGRVAAEGYAELTEKAWRLYNSGHFDIEVLKTIVLKSFKLNPEYPMTVILCAVLLIVYQGPGGQKMEGVSYLIGLLKKDITQAEKALALNVLVMAKHGAQKEQDKIIIEALIESYKGK